MSDPFFSVVICTRDRPENLARLLESLTRLDYPAYEVLVVDNASRGPETRALAERFNCRCVREERVGLDWARNRGAAEAASNWIAYLDDDVVPEQGWLAALAAGFADPSVDAITGLVLPARLETPAERLFEAYSGMGKGAEMRRFCGAALSWPERIAAQHVGVGANMAFRRAALERVGGFDPALDVGTPAGGGGDLDIFHRLLVAGMQILYLPQAQVSHYHRRELPALRRQLYFNGRSYGVYLLKILLRGSAPRRVTLRLALGWFGGWVVRRWAAGLLGHLDFPQELLWAELWGSLQAPWAYVLAYWGNHKKRVKIHLQRGGA